ncbi:hypothetical protein LPJ53_001198 [Coemansia erecta]|uniref:Uncharacterized protein n=1 Tax=Coemansia erecta TaxID=147472 RepID=A0A9W7Y4U4_9FUNG|nr:hypothetical protein LPJ53_001198 [Coemansia erecta]
MKLQLSVSILIVALAAYAQSADTVNNRPVLDKRGMIIGDSPVIVAEETPARSAVDAITADDSTGAAAVGVAGSQIAQPPTVLLDTSMPSIRGSSLGFLQVQQGSVAPQLILSPGLGTTSNLQRVVDTSQVLVQAQPAGSAPAVTIVQAISVAPAATPAAPATSISQVAAAQVSSGVATSASAASTAASTVASALEASTSASQATVTVTAAASTSPAAPATATVTVAASVAPVAQSLAVPAAAPAALPAAAPVSIPAIPSVAAAAAPVVGAASISGTSQVALAAPAAQLAYPDLLAAQPAASGALAAAPAVAAPLAAAAAVDAVAAPSTFAQQQLYPAAVAAAPAAQAVAGAGAIPTAMILGNNPNAAPVIISADSQLTDLLSQVAAVTTPAAAEATPDSDATSVEDDAVVDDSTAVLTGRHAAKPIGRYTNPQTVGRKSKTAIESVDIAAADSDPVLPDSSIDSAEEDIASVGTTTLRKGKTAAAKAAAKKKTNALKSAVIDADSDPAADAVASAADTDIAAAPVAHYHATANIVDDAATVAAADATSDIDSAAAALASTDADAAPAHVPGSRQRGTSANIKDEAAKARAEASAEAREAVLSEVRAEASAEAALQASSELHLNGRTVVHDEAAQYDYSKDQSQSSYADESDHYSRTTDSSYSTGYGSDTYSHDHESYTDDYKDSSTYGDWKLHYDGHSPTIYQASEGSSNMNFNTEPHSYTDGAYNVRYTDHQSDYEHEHEHDHYHDNSDYETQSKPYNFANMHAVSALERDAASGASSAAGGASGSVVSLPSNGLPHAVNELDPLSYATEACTFRKDLPLVASDSPVSACPSIMVIGVPQPTMMSAPASSVVPQASTVMITKMVTPAVKVVVASTDNDTE